MSENEFKFKKLVVGSIITRQLNLKTKPTSSGNDHPVSVIVNQLVVSGVTEPLAYPTRMFATEEDVCGLVTGDIGNCIVIWSTGTVKCVAYRKHTDISERNIRYTWTAQLDEESICRLDLYLKHVESIMTKCLQEITSTETIEYNNH